MLATPCFFISVLLSFSLLISGSSWLELNDSFKIDVNFCFGPYFSAPEKHKMAFHKHMCISSGIKGITGVSRNTSLGFKTDHKYHPGVLIYWNHKGNTGNPIHDLVNFIAPFVYFMENCVHEKIPGVHHFLIDPCNPTYNRNGSRLFNRDLCFVKYHYKFNVIWMRCALLGLLTEYTSNESLVSEHGCYESVIYVESEYSGMFNPLRSVTEGKPVPFQWSYIEKFTEREKEYDSPQVRHSKAQLAPFQTYLMPLQKLRQVSVLYFDFEIPASFRGSADSRSRMSSLLKILVLSRLTKYQRGVRRAWLDVDATLYHLKSALLPNTAKIHHQMAFQGTSFYNQMKLFVDTDIVITVHGGHLGNLIFLKRHAVVLISRKFCFSLSADEEQDGTKEDVAIVQDQWFAWMEHIFEFRWVLMDPCVPSGNPNDENFRLSPQIVEKHLRDLKLPGLRFRS